MRGGSPAGLHFLSGGNGLDVCIEELFPTRLCKVLVRLFALQPGPHHRRLLGDNAAELLHLRDLLSGDLVADLQCLHLAVRRLRHRSQLTHRILLTVELIGGEARSLKRAGNRVAVRIRPRLIGRRKALGVRQVGLEIGIAFKPLLQKIVGIAHGEGDALTLIDDITQLVQIAFDLAPNVVRKLGRILQHVLVDVELVLDLLGKLRDLLDLVIDLLCRLADKMDELTIVEHLRHFGRTGNRPSRVGNIGRRGQPGGNQPGHQRSAELQILDWFTHSG